MSQRRAAKFQFNNIFRRIIAKHATGKTFSSHRSSRINTWQYLPIWLKTSNPFLFLEKLLMTYVIEHNHSQTKFLRWTPRSKTLYFFLNAHSLKSTIQLFTLAKKSTILTWTTLTSSSIFTSFFSTKLLNLFTDIVSIHKKKISTQFTQSTHLLTLQILLNNNGKSRAFSLREELGHSVLYNQPLRVHHLFFTQPNYQALLNFFQSVILLGWNQLNLQQHYAISRLTLEARFMWLRFYNLYFFKVSNF